MSKVWNSLRIFTFFFTFTSVYAGIDPPDITCEEAAKTLQLGLKCVTHNPIIATENSVSYVLTSGKPEEGPLMVRIDDAIGSTEKEATSRHVSCLINLNVSPFVPKFFDYKTNQKYRFTVTEYPEKGFVKDLIFREPELFKDPRKVLNIVRSIAIVLQEMHFKETVHAGINDMNVMITADDNAKVVNFRQAYRTNLYKTHYPLVIRDEYMDPNLWSSRQMTPDYTIDVYALGVLLYEMAHDGQFPFHESPHPEDPPESESHSYKIKDGLEQNVVFLINNCLQFQQEQRIPISVIIRTIDEYLHTEEDVFVRGFQANLRTVFDESKIEVMNVIKRQPKVRLLMQKESDSDVLLQNEIRQENIENKQIQIERRLEMNSDNENDDSQFSEKEYIKIAYVLYVITLLLAFGFAMYALKQMWMSRPFAREDSGDTVPRTPQHAVAAVAHA